MAQDMDNREVRADESSFMERFVDTSLHPVENHRFAALKITAYVILFLLFVVLNALVGSVSALDFLVPFRGVFSLVQLMLSILIVQSQSMKGFYAVIVVSVLQIVATVVAMARFEDTFALNGLASTVLSLIIVGIILAYNRRVAQEIERVEAKTEELEKANSDLKKREEETKRQNTLLSEYNRAMKENEERLYQMNHFDTVTGLPNRVKITDRMDLLISLLSNKNMPFALIYVDLDNFKTINDSMGHKVGDLVLQSAASRLTSSIDQEDMIGRWGGDEFAIVVQRQFSDEDMLNYVESLRDTLAKPFNIEDSEYTVTASFGVSFFPQDGTTSAELIKCAETAMYKAKDYGKNMVQFYRKEMKDDIMRKMKYESRLLSAIKNRELYLCFQPQYDMKERKLRGFEALCRWNSERFGEVPPTEFIPVAESVGFIVPLGEWVLESACLALNRIKAANNWDGIMSVNISAVQLMSPMFLQSVKRIIKNTGVDTKNLEFEVTESVMVSNVDYAVKVLKEISAMGITVALDDFGTGYSSLNYLQQLPINVLKIDKSFVDELPIKNAQRLMVGSIIGLVHQMKIKVVAEGVDDRRQLDILTKYQCDFVQGNIWGRPIMENEITQIFSAGAVADAH
ncbi:MAG: bifunctional diguanylate cyclase/phosphodiesterase [Clostridiales bacterium]|nr:bifunctional diguanylate cyclase/phosphodiesterase [Clostridiales bacterium]